MAIKSIIKTTHKTVNIKLTKFFPENFLSIPYMKPNNAAEGIIMEMPRMPIPGPHPFFLKINSYKKYIIIVEILPATAPISVDSIIVDSLLNK